MGRWVGAQHGNSYIRCQWPLRSPLKHGVESVRGFSPSLTSIRAIVLPLLYPAYIRMEKSLKLESFALSSHSRSIGSQILGRLKINWGHIKMPNFQAFQFSSTWPGSQKAKPEAKAYILPLYGELESQRNTRRAKGVRKGRKEYQDRGLLLSPCSHTVPCRVKPVSHKTVFQ